MLKNLSFRAANLFSSGISLATKPLPKSQEQVTSDKLTDLSQESDMDHLEPSKSEFSLAPHKTNVNSEDNEIVIELVEEKNNGKGKIK